jgi:hypothetical protein
MNPVSTIHSHRSESPGFLFLRWGLTSSFERSKADV